MAGFLNFSRSPPELGMLIDPVGDGDSILTWKVKLDSLYAPMRIDPRIAVCRASIKRVGLNPSDTEDSTGLQVSATSSSRRFDGRISTFGPM